MQRKIVVYPDPVLARKADVIEEITPEIDSLISDMIETMYEKDGVGLAAPQLGESIRLICMDQTGPKVRGDLHVLVNPEIVEAEGQIEGEEGCLSVVGGKYNIVRNQRIRVQGLDRNGDPVELELEDYPAVIAQHEIDHLEGVLIIDRISRLKRLMYDKKVKKWIKNDQMP